MGDRCGEARVYRHVKRTLDAVISLLSLVALVPVLACIGAAVLVDLGRPVLFGQQRPGLHGRPFVILKFRTMRAPAAGRELDDDEERLTRLGRFLRSTSLDELPELVNVLRGDMSLVGPRPLLVHYQPRFSPQQARRSLVRPGITGLAQVSGRNALPWDERLSLDVVYVERVSLWLDVRILVRTIAHVIRRDGIDADGEVGSSEFIGTASAAPDHLRKSDQASSRR